MYNQRMLAIRLPADLEERLEALVRKTGRTKTYYAREAIVEYLEDLEDFYLAEDRLRRFSDAEAILLDDVIRRHGVAD